MASFREKSTATCDSLHCGDCMVSDRRKKMSYYTSKCCLLPVYHVSRVCTAEIHVDIQTVL